MRKLILVLCFISSSLLTYGQLQLDLNASHHTMRKAAYVSQIPKGLTEKVLAIREFQVNPQLQKVGRIQKGDQIGLSLFEKKNYQAVIDRVEIDVNQSVIVSAKLPDYPLGYVIISTAATGKSLVTVEIPELDEHFKSVSDVSSQDSYLVQFANSEHDHAKCGGEMIAEETKAVESEEEGKHRIGEVLSNCDIPAFGLNTATNATIRILVLYTADAAAWSNANQGGIVNTISSGLAQTQNVWNNSQIGATVELAHSAQVSYTESGSLYTDLARLQTANDGFLDNVEALRKTHSADLVSLLVGPNSGGIAGLAYLLTQQQGRYDYAYSTLMVTYFNSLTTPHELGHNMGMSHDVANAGTGSRIVPYSFGWRWNGNNSEQYRSVMSYDPGNQIPYLSSPIQNYQGTPMGDAANADNARLGREVKHVIADYKHKLSHIPDIATNLIVNSTHDHGANISWNPVVGASGYRVSYLYEGSWRSYGAITNTSFQINSPLHFQPGATYRWRIETIGDCSGVISHSLESTFTTTGNPLLVKLINFEGSVQEYSIHLNWATSIEYNSSHYEVESSVNGQDWKVIGYTTAAGTTDQSQKYDFIDMSPLGKRNHYRLKVVDRDQKFEYSRIVSVDMPELPLIVYPNPSNAELGIKGLLIDTVESIQLMSQTGQIVLQHKGIWSNKLNVELLPTGLYVLQVNYLDKRKVTRKVLISR